MVCSGSIGSILLYSILTDRKLIGVFEIGVLKSMGVSKNREVAFLESQKAIGSVLYMSNSLNFLKWVM